MDYDESPVLGEAGPVRITHYSLPKDVPTRPITVEFDTEILNRIARLTGKELEHGSMYPWQKPADLIRDATVRYLEQVEELVRGGVGRRDGFWFGLRRLWVKSHELKSRQWEQENWAMVRDHLVSAVQTRNCPIMYEGVKDFVLPVQDMLRDPTPSGRQWAEKWKSFLFGQEVVRRAVVLLRDTEPWSERDEVRTAAVWVQDVLEGSDE